MLQKIIKVGNSYALTIPISFMKEANIKAGDQVHVVTDVEEGKMLVTKADPQTVETPEVKEWLEKFNKKYKKGLTELAKR